MRARNIKPGFFENEDLAECSVEARYIFIGLWMIADWKGRLENRPRKIKRLLAPSDAFDINECLAELAQWGLIKFYGDDPEGDSYLWIPGFSKHQSPHYSEKSKPSCFPPHPEEPEEGEVFQEHSRKTGQDSGNAPGAPTEPPESTPGVTRPESGILNAESGILTPDTPSPESACAPEAVAETTPQYTKAIREAWNDVAKAHGLQVCRKLGPSRSKAAQARWRDQDWREHYAEALERLKGIRWIRGENDRNWIADIDWFLRPETLNKILEGKYDDDKGSSQSPTYEPTTPWTPL